MKTISKLFILILFVASCESYTEDINTDPNEFTTAPPELIIGQAQLGWMQLATSNSARYAGIFMNHFTGEDRQYVTVNQYSTTAADYDDTWEDAYVRGIEQAQLTRDLALESGNLQLAGIAQICEAAIFGEMAALFGDIPFSQANNIDEFPTPEYDSQASVLSGIQTILDQAITNVGDLSASTYAGNRLSSAATWAEIAHSLKARYYLIAKDYPNALISARNGIDTPEKSLITQHTTALNSENLYYQFMVDERDGYLGATDSHLKNLLDGTVARTIATPGDAERFDFYFTAYSDGTGHAPNVTNDGVFAETAPMNIISYEEVKLIEAEAANRTNDAGDVTAFNEVRAFLATEYGSSFPATTSASGSNALLMEIVEEKYITLIGELQPFHDIRRTGNMLNVPPKTGATIPQRFIYPQIEVDANPNIPSPLPTLFDPTPIN
ncbi:SusD/RagB family nutrient-binding outer membrane lipoprotein [Winogradskyella vincentii]|uniref:SusD/RagB family nutrient-binding outer membrane lipoprotein n=1 Tax=Winogradskyella vincentii TaxID=2877122 RepID=A0ABS7Y265_9FLAO|nr:SusD/RagB family nutrient-binding outer membrane lipoprotein [Winogradskyella vincentii]MCA0154016.1 SusD/RagB family nutrient-binding outer membrane lipoprotein [Winogradskyella vincentii]